MTYEDLFAQAGVPPLLVINGRQLLLYRLLYILNVFTLTIYKPKLRFDSCTIYLFFLFSVGLFLLLLLLLLSTFP